MAKLLLNLRHVPDDESAEIRELLDRRHVDYYETRPSPWGISAGGLWVKDPDEFARANALLADYQQARGERARAERRQALEQGRAETFGSLLRARPLFVLLVLAGMVLVASLVLLPFLLLSR